jgi:hypothetical protein
MMEQEHRRSDQDPADTNHTQIKREVLPGSTAQFSFDDWD